MIMTNSHSKHRRRDAKLGFTFASLGLHPVRAPWTRAPLSAPTPNTTTLTIHRAYPISLTSYPKPKQGMAATHFLPRLLPQQIATRLLLTGEIVSGAEAQRLGLVAESVPQVHTQHGLSVRA